MKRRYNTLGRRLLSVLAPANGGPRKRSVLLGLALAHGHDARNFAKTLKRLLESGAIVMRGGKRGTTYALGKAAA